MNSDVMEATPVAASVSLPSAVDLCASLLEARLSGSSLPALACDQVRLQFSGRIFEPAELDKAVESARTTGSRADRRQCGTGTGAHHRRV